LPLNRRDIRREQEGAQRLPHLRECGVVRVLQSDADRHPALPPFAHFDACVLYPHPLRRIASKLRLVDLADRRQRNRVDEVDVPRPGLNSRRRF
jgi:hypothetical protein